MMTFTHAKVTVKFTVHGYNLPASGMDPIRPFFEAPQDAALLVLYLEAGIEEVGGPLISWKRSRDGMSASCKLECWVYGALVGGYVSNVFIEAIKRCRAQLPWKASEFMHEGASTGRIERIEGPRGVADPVAGPTDFRTGTHAQKRKHRSSAHNFPEGAVAILRGFTLHELTTLDAAARYSGAGASGGAP